MSDPTSLEISEQEIARQFPGFTVTPPLRRRDIPDPVRFTDSWSQDQYLAHRSGAAPETTIIHHLLDGAGVVVGFLVYHLQDEDLEDHINLRASVDAVHIEQPWRGHGLSRLLLSPVRRAVMSALWSVNLSGRAVSVHYDGPWESNEGRSVLRSMGRDLLAMTRSHSNVTIEQTLAL